MDFTAAHQYTYLIMKHAFVFIVSRVRTSLPRPFFPKNLTATAPSVQAHSFPRFSIFVVLLVFKQECSKDTARFVMHLLCLCDTVDSFAVRLQKFLEGFTKSTKNVTQDILTRTRNWIHSN